MLNRNENSQCRCLMPGKSIEQSRTESIAKYKSFSRETKKSILKIGYMSHSFQDWASTSQLDAYSRRRCVCHNLNKILEATLKLLSTFSAVRGELACEYIWYQIPGALVCLFGRFLLPRLLYSGGGLWGYTLSDMEDEHGGHMHMPLSLQYSLHCEGA